jgi:hypothetical protein
MAPLEEEFEIDSEQCWRMGLIVSELVSSAARRVAGKSPSHIRVTAGRRGALIWCQIEDDGEISETQSGDRDALTNELHGALEQYERGAASSQP